VFKKFTYTLVLILASLLAYPYSGKASGDDKLIEIQYVSGSPDLFVKINDLTSDIDQLEITTLLGRKIKFFKYTKGEERVRLQGANELPDGIYVVVARGSNGKILATSKITIAK
jgi:hypothetical protein